MTIIKRADLGRPLTWDELDDNFQQVDDLTAAASAAVSSAAASATAAAGSAANSLNSANSASSFAADASASATVAINALMNSTFEPNSFDFTTGGTLDTTDRNKAVYNPADNNWYSWSGTLPKIVSAGEDPTVDSNWRPRTDQILREDLASTAEGMGSNLVTGNRYHTVHDIIARLKAYQDYGVNNPPALGRDQTINQEIWDDQTSIDLKHRGGLFAGKETFGIRENACVASFRANAASGGAFVPQVAGSDDLAVLAQLGALDSVAVFADTWLGEYNSWEDIATANYTATSFTVSDASLLENVKVGQYLMTKHSSRYVGLVTGISGATVTVQKWVIYGTSTVGTPADGIGLYVNPIIKGWAVNANVLIGPNSRAEKCALFEFGLQNNGISNTALVTGGDIVALDATYGGGDGLRVRGASATGRWTNSVSASGGISTNFRSSTGQGPSALAAFLEESTSATGFLFKGNNTSRSVSWQNTSGVEQTALAPYGFEVKGGKGISTAASGTAVSQGGKVVVPNSGAFSLVLPDASTFTAGREIHFILTGIGAITITSAQSGGTVNGSSSIIVTPSAGFTEATATYAGGGSWYFTR